MSQSITIAELIEGKGDSLDLELLTPEVPLTGPLSDPDVSGPGLALAGFLDRFPGDRIQVVGETEMEYLRALQPETLRERLEGLFRFPIPAIFITKGLDVPHVFIDMAEEQGIPVLRSSLTTKAFFRKIKPFLETALAPSTNIHGSLVGVYGVGLLFVGQSGIGKSECVLDLVERGHRLVADDLVIVSRRGNDILMGRSHERQMHHMEIRGIGIIDIRALFGMRAVRQQKRLEVIVQLERWTDDRTYDRTGLQQEETEILGVKIPKVTVPLNPGKNITVIAEVVAMNHLLRYSGVDSAAEFNLRLQKSMRPLREYLEEDYE